MPWSCSAYVVLQLHVGAAGAEDVPQAPGVAERRIEVVPQQRLADVAPEAARARQDALGVLGQDLPVHLGLVVVALEEGSAGDLDEVAVARLAIRQQGQVVVELVAGGRLSAAVVHLALPGGALVAALVGHVGLDAQDGLHAAGAAGLVERHDPVEVPVVGYPERRLAVGRGGRHERFDPRGAVEHRVLGVGVQVNEAVRHSPLPRLSAPQTVGSRGCRLPRLSTARTVHSPGCPRGVVPSCGQITVLSFQGRP